MSGSFAQHFPADSEQAKRVQLVAIGQGKPKFAQQFTEVYKFHGSIYVDPSASLFARLKFVNRRARGAVCCASCATCCSLLCYFGYGMCCRCWCPCQVGDMKQNGGIIVVDQQGRLIYKHVEKEVNDHPSPEGIMGMIPTK